MDSADTIRSLRRQLANIAKTVDWMEKSGEIHPLDVELLMNKTRELYSQLMEIESGPVIDTMGSGDQEEATGSETTELVVVSPIPEAPVEAVSEPAEPETEMTSEPEDAEPEPEPTEAEEEILQEAEEEEMEDFEPEEEPDIEIPEQSGEAFVPSVQPGEVAESSREPEFLMDFDLDFEPEEEVPQPFAVETPPAPEPEPVRPQDPVVGREDIRREQPAAPSSSYLFSPPPPVAEKRPGRDPLAEASLFQRDSSLNETLGKQKTGQDIASSIIETPVTDIWSAITINERFLFIRELFGNDAESFKNTVILLNSLNSWESASRFLTDRFTWQKDDPVAADFLNIVRRRFLK